MTADVSRETQAKFEAFADLLRKWTARINLISPATVTDLWTRHIVDSIQVFEAAPEGWTSWTDMGSGGGLPGCVIGILASGQQHVTLIESDQRKATFLRTAQRELSLPITVICARIEDVEQTPQDVVSARALSALPDLLELTVERLSPTGVALFPKGRKWAQEIAIAQAQWDFDCEEIPSKTSDEARILRIKGINRREP